MKSDRYYTKEELLTFNDCATLNNCSSYCTSHIDLHNNTKLHQELLMFLLDVLGPHMLAWSYDKIIALSYPILLAICNQTTSEGGLAQLSFNLNGLNANSVWTG